MLFILITSLSLALTSQVQGNELVQVSQGKNTPIGAAEEISLKTPKIARLKAGGQNYELVFNNKTDAQVFKKAMDRGLLHDYSLNADWQAKNRKIEAHSSAGDVFLDPGQVSSSNVVMVNKTSGKNITLSKFINSTKKKLKEEDLRAQQLEKGEYRGVSGKFQKLADKIYGVGTYEKQHDNKKVSDQKSVDKGAASSSNVVPAVENSSAGPAK
ncbi:MAG: hypothetical protein AABZ06_04615 [Bdellovibrionota bacterium]